MNEAEVSVSIDVQCSPDRVWEAIADVSRLATWSPETTGVTTSAGPPLVVGDTFRGSNRNGPFWWRTSCKVIESKANETFGFDVTFFGMAVSRWRFTVEPLEGGARVTEQWSDRRGLPMNVMAPLGTGVLHRAPHNERTMRATLDNLKADLENAERPAG
jgi:uncharacterized protein YndB with AHSA1/START domain